MKHKKYRNRAVCALMLMLAFSMAGCGAQSTSVASEMNLESSTAEETEETSMPEQNITTEDVTFTNEDSGLELAGILFRPDGFDEAKTYPAVVVAGPMLSVKEQAQSVYAQRLAEQGYLSMVFDYSYFGESEGEPRQLEVPDVKASDISSAVTFLQSLPYVEDERIGGVGICGSGSYMPYAAISDERIHAVVSIVPATTMDSMISMPLDQAEADQKAYEAGEAEPTYVDLMPRAYAEGAAYYYNEDRGWRENWDNHAVSWSELSWVNFHPTELAAQLNTPYLVITGENAWSRPGAEKMYENAASADKEFYLIDGAGHFDVYDLEPYVTEAMEQIIPFFAEHLG